MFSRRQILSGLGTTALVALMPDALRAASIKPDETSALLVIDVQNCFLPGGSLAVKDGEQGVQEQGQLRPALIVLLESAAVGSIGTPARTSARSTPGSAGARPGSGPISLAIPSNEMPACWASGTRSTIVLTMTLVLSWSSRRSELPATLP